MFQWQLMGESYFDTQAAIIGGLFLIVFKSISLVLNLMYSLNRKKL